MLKVENLETWGFEHAIRGMRNPMNSWDKSDSKWDIMSDSVDIVPFFLIGENDLDLMKRLYKSGNEHRTYARMIYAWMDITAPLYWWKEMDRYTVGKSQVSCSTMHKIAAKEFELDDFSHEHLSDYSIAHALEPTIDTLNHQRELYLTDKSKTWWWQLIQLLPSSYNQKRTVCMSYEVIFKIIKERTGHKLDEWNDFIEELKKLPYVKAIIGEDETLAFGENIYVLGKIINDAIGEKDGN